MSKDRSNRNKNENEREAGYWELKAWFERPPSEEEISDSETRRSEWREFFGEELADILLGRRVRS